MKPGLLALSFSMLRCRCSRRLTATERRESAVPWSTTTKCSRDASGNSFSSFEEPLSAVAKEVEGGRIISVRSRRRPTT